MTESFLNDRVTLHPGDCLEVLARLEENSVDSVVTDPPYHLTSIVKRFGAENAAPAKVGKTGAYARASSGFMGKQWDGGDIAFRIETWQAILRVLKPGGHLLAFSGTRTYHRMAVAIDDAGFEVRDMISWLYGSGFPKSHDVSKGIDRANGDDRPVLCRAKGAASSDTESLGEFQPEYDLTSAASAAAAASAAWEGWGTALKPACEPIVLARKPLSESTVAANVLRWGTGALNIDACRVASGDDLNGGAYSGGERRRDEYSATDSTPDAVALSRLNRGIGEFKQPPGRWPANVIHDGSDEVVGAFPDAPGQQRRVGPEFGEKKSRGIYGDYGLLNEHEPRGDSGSAARFFYTAKADSDDRLGSKHPTVKPLDLMQYLVRLVTPKGGLVLDPFAGTGTTGEAAWREGMRAVLIEREEEYQNDIRRRMALCLSGAGERARESIKARMKDKPVDAGPLFAGSETPPRTGRQIYGVFADEPSGRRD